jgi:hypothetical protein
MDKVVGADAGEEVREQKCKESGLRMKDSRRSSDILILNDGLHRLFRIDRCRHSASQILSSLLFFLVAFNALCHLKGNGRLGLWYQSFPSTLAEPRRHTCVKWWILCVMTTKVLVIVCGAADKVWSMILYDEVLQTYPVPAYVNNECQPTIAISHVRDYGQIDNETIYRRTEGGLNKCAVDTTLFESCSMRDSD